MGLTDVSVRTGVPVGFGVLTCDTEQQGLDRAGLPGPPEDKGHEAMTAALDTGRDPRRAGRLGSRRRAATQWLPSGAVGPTRPRGPMRACERWEGVGTSPYLAKATAAPQRSHAGQPRKADPRRRPEPSRLETVKTFESLFDELSEKAAARPAGSRTVAELESGIHAIGKKIVEEAAEVWMAAEYESDEAAAEEISQLFYHLQVLMIAKGLTLQDVYRHL